LLNLYKNADITNLRVLSFNYLLLWGRGSASPSLQRLYRGKGALLRVCKAQGICSAEKEQESNLDLVYKI